MVGGEGTRRRTRKGVAVVAVVAVLVVLVVAVVVVVGGCSATHAK